MADGVRAVHVTIAGRVQGVGFRAFVADEARRRRLAGWVRNLSGGGVEAVFCGAAEAVEATVAACRDGPDFARVDDIRVVAIPPGGETAFTILPTR